MYAYDDYLIHYGILGMKWGVRRTPSQLGSKKISTTKTTATKSSTLTKKSSKSKSVKKMSSEELKKRIDRMEMEKKYNTLMKETDSRAAGKDFVMKVLKKSGDNIATQLATYAMGEMVNKALKQKVVNPKKGQKDK